MKNTTRYYSRSIKEFMVHGGFQPCNTDYKDVAITEAVHQSLHVHHMVTVDDVDGNCIARAYNGVIELTA